MAVQSAHTLQDNFIYSCTFHQQRGYEQFVAEHVLAYQISGETRIFHQGGTLTLAANQLLLARKDQLTKTLKLPLDGKEYKILSIVLDGSSIRKFAVENNIVFKEKYAGDNNILLEPSPFLTGYFQSLLPYVESSETIPPKLAALKINEAIELVLRLQPGLSTFLFDFSEPYKIDLEKFMNQNFQYNVAVENFAKLTGRSVAAFKRDFATIFNAPPRKWLQNKRLSEAHHLISQEQKKPAEIYLDLGFENLSHFYTSFKNKYGVTPAQI